jgi:hypothetical protein
MMNPNEEGSQPSALCRAAAADADVASLATVKDTEALSSSSSSEAAAAAAPSCSNIIHAAVSTHITPSPKAAAVLANAADPPLLKPHCVPAASPTTSTFGDNYNSNHNLDVDPKEENDNDDIDNSSPSPSVQPPSTCLGKAWERWCHFYNQYEFLILVVMAICLAKAYPPLGATYLQPQITSTWIAVLFIFGASIIYYTNQL